MIQTEPTPPFRRRVFYIPGYDPFPPRRYRELYRSESAAQAAISGYTVAQTPLRRGDGPFGWRVRTETDGRPAEAEVFILEWSDIVKASMQAGVLATYLLLLRTAWTYLASGAIFGLFRLRLAPGIAAMYPVVMLLGQLAVALAVAAGLGWALGLVVPGWIGWLLGLAVVPPILSAFRRLDGRFFAYYLLLDFAFTARDGGRNPPALEARLAEFADRVASALADPELDEVLVVGHSSGVHLAVSVLADVIRAGAVREGGAALGFVSLGHAVPMQSYLPNATRLRRDLHYLSQRPELFWLDVTAPGDGCTYALCDPVGASGAAPEHGQRWPVVISAAFRDTLAPETFARLRRRYFRLHFQYLCAFERPRDYDYFQITAGPMTLAERFAARRSSASATAVSFNRYTSRDPEP